MAGYEDARGHPADFLVEYRFYTEDEGGRPSLPNQRYRGDFLFAEDDPADGLWMIHHEFLSGSGEVLASWDELAPRSGRATMWILFPRTRALLQTRLSVGARYFIMEGRNKVGEGEVVEVLGLHDNPVG